MSGIHSVTSRQCASDAEAAFLSPPAGVSSRVAAQAASTRPVGCRQAGEGQRLAIRMWIKLGPRSAQPIVPTHLLKILSPHFSPPSAPSPILSPIALAGDLVRTGDQERASVPGWSSAVGGWVMNP